MTDLYDAAPCVRKTASYGCTAGRGRPSRLDPTAMARRFPRERPGFDPGFRARSWTDRFREGHGEEDRRRMEPIRIFSKTG